MKPRDARIDDSFDEDLKKALAMSLEESKDISAAINLPSLPPIHMKASRSLMETPPVRRRWGGRR